MAQQAIMVRVSQAQSVFGVNKSTLYRWAAKDQIRIYKRGAMSFVDPAEVSDFIKGVVDKVVDTERKGAN